MVSKIRPVRQARESSDSGENCTGKLSTKASMQPTGKKKKAPPHAPSAAAEVPEEIHGRIGTFAWKNGREWSLSGSWEFFRRNEPLGPDLQQKTCVKANYFRTYHCSPKTGVRNHLAGPAKSLTTAETKQASEFPLHQAPSQSLLALHPTSLYVKEPIIKSMLCVTPRITLAIFWQQLP